MSYFKDKVIAIMGGEGSMGSATAWLLALQGACVSIADYETHPETDFRNGDACKMLGQVKKSIVDIRNEHVVKLWIQKTVSDFGKIDGFFSFAGVVSKDFLHVRKSGPLSEVITNARKNDIECINNKEWQRTLDINITGTMNCLKAVFPKMDKGGSKCPGSRRYSERLRLWCIQGWCDCTYQMRRSRTCCEGYSNQQVYLHHW